MLNLRKPVKAEMKELISVLLGTLLLYIPMSDCVQEFEQRPVNTSVTEGQNVMLQCSVRDLAGMLQWSKGGIMLGLGPSLPGFARYSIVSNTPSQYNLLIENTRLLDDSYYECQASPASGNPPLKAGAYLTVQVPPEQPEILGYANASTIALSPDENQLIMSCEVRRGHPAATIEWFRNGNLVTENVRYSTEPVITGSKLMTARSTMTITNIADHHNSIYMCRAKNDALGNNWMQTFVKLNVLSPPGKPEITGYSSGQVIREGDTLRLLCVSKGGNPLPQVKWYRNGVQKDISYTTDSADAQSLNEYLFPVRREDNGAVYRCEASNTASLSPLTTEVTLNVYFPPRTATITGGSTEVKAGQQVTLTCESSLSNPKAVMTWYSRGKIITANSDPVYTPGSNGGFTTRSSVTVTMSEQEDNAAYICNAVSDNRAPVATANVTISVLYPPGAPTIEGYSESSHVTEDRPARMTCKSVGGNPTATLKWFKGNQPLISVSSTSGNMVTSELSFLPTPGDNNAIYKCEASNLATSSPLTALVKLTVYFAPKGVNVSMNPSQPVSGQPLRLTCASESSNPPATIVWIKNHDQTRELRGVTEGTAPASNGGSTTTNYLDIVPSSRDHNVTYYCKAKNEYINKSTSDGLRISIQFGPVFQPSVSQIGMIEGESRTLDMEAIANPTTITYTLYKRTQQSNSFTPNNGKLVISNVQRGQAGNYSLKATNSIGSAYHHFQVKVKFPAEIIRFQETVYAIEGESASIICGVNGNPSVDNMASWSRPGFDMSKTKQVYKNSESQIIIYDLERTDSGKFKCTADNQVGEPQSKEANVVVKYFGNIDKSRQYAKAGGKHGDTVILICKAEGTPEMQFTWLKEGTEIQRDGKFGISSTTATTIFDTKFKSELTVRSIAKADYGTYTCKARNDRGQDQFNIHLNGTSKPDPPYNLTFVNSTRNSLTFSWKPGFNGGLDQEFRIQYQRKGSKSVTTKSIDVDKSVDKIVLTIKGLEFGHEYLIDVLAINELGETWDEQQFSARTAVSGGGGHGDSSATPATRQSGDDTPVMIILVVCIVGICLLALNIALIFFFVRRRRKRMGHGGTSNHTNALELYAPGKENSYPMYPKTPSDECHSYGTYEKNMDDLSDDFRNYEHIDQKSTSTHSSNIQCNCYTVRLSSRVNRGSCCLPPESSGSSGDEDVKRVFLPPPAYSSHPYTPNKLDSPHLSTHKAYLSDSHSYIDDDREGHWQYEDPYKMKGRKGTFDPQYERGSQTVINDDRYYDETRPKQSITDLSERSSRPPSRNVNYRTTPPPPPVRSTSKGAAINYMNHTAPPLPDRNYDADEIQHFNPRYTPSPGSIASFSNNPNVITNPNYDGPMMRASRTDIVPDDMRGHLV
ncbi:nephrin-like isoform X3 [Ostrea edulis]|uniref:nephrin-like isoform X3 n=1 Tax=Ostrea edulis TaxID=37623 RepID=UPI0024AF91B3|nr:nephrin-like isoform X3 [Ostrea edulis]XP_056011050.1 nephrin-like isoform X3 [Ostrea edulis]XP_056011051.1 nephrin-like isoform X3 [Ostrea edulis]XP_056011052.1 nephrin-like isoform X3 [Ostrea edulis]XP_056011053.1 nephrin-like isoform X3 [Ostrea edulis]XP_056011054.1 nephrin-like isoform X3 [Ostrea edulis]XP_056011055.1 nephrin-like isoform X3 [Ostrea edulis]XP_056011056.1 nephrin-like isoform X3 [Ostrea edulis]XP_056011057.1 nephrin-like isoform X3 [Ostrea edulis]XP_056011058.1 nephr